MKIGTINGSIPITVLSKVSFKVTQKIYKNSLIYFQVYRINGVFALHFGKIKCNTI